jgi:Kef-type K+ transport system membrane component KefB
MNLRTRSVLDQIIHRALPVTICLGLLIWLRGSNLGIDGMGPHSTTVAVGFLLIGAFVGGKLAARVGLPRITGYLLVGVILGPYGSALLTTDMMAARSTLDGVAVSLIALTAGGELKLDWLRRQIGRLAVITAFELTTVLTGVGALMLLGAGLFSFMPTDDWTHALIVAFVFGAIAVTASPTVTIAVIADTRSDGPVTRTVLGVTILKDVWVIILFATAITVAKNALGESDAGNLGLTLLREIGGSILVGVGFGVGLSQYLLRINREVPVVLLACCFTIAELSTAFHLEALLVALTAGFWIQNFSRADGNQLIAAIERVSLPVYALFFAGAGAKIDLASIGPILPLVLLTVVVRAACVFGGTRLGMHVAGVEPQVKRYGWLGLISQAGVSLALASIVARAFPGWGTEVQVLIIAMIAVHELVGPIGFQYALRKAGEIGKAPSPDNH